MALTIVDRRTIIDEGDSLTGWTGASISTTDDVAELSAAVAEAVNIGNQPMYFTAGASIDLSDTLVYVYSFNNALQDAWNAVIPPNGLFLGDGTDQIAFKMAGADKRVFNHLDGPTNWQCLVLDGSKASTMNTDGLTYVVAGSFAGLAMTAITQIGAYHKTNSKALGGGFNVACDIIRYGNDGLYVLAGGSGTEGTFLELAQSDRSTADQAGHGIFRELNPSSFGIQGPLTFGRSDTATTSYFKDSGKSVTFEDRDIGDGKYYFDIAGNSGATNYFSLTNSTIGTAGPSVSMTCTSNINTLIMNAVSFVNWRGGIQFPTDTITNSLSHTVSNSSFSNCDQIVPNSVSFTGNNISNYNGVTNGALLINSTAEVGSWGNLSFTSAGTGHAILIDTTGTYDFSNFKYSGYATTDGTTGNEVVYNNSGGAVTINILNGGDTPTVRNGTGATTTIANNTSITLTGMRDNTEVRVYDQNTPPNELAGIENATTGTTNDRSFTFSLSAGTIVDIVIVSVEFENERIEDFTIPNNDASIPISQDRDRNYNNP